MAKKKKVEKPKREYTKRQLSRWQQQKRRQRIIFGSGILIIIAVLGVVGAGVYNGWYVPEYKPLHETVIEVNETEFNMDYYIKMLKYNALKLESYGVSVGLEELSYLADGTVEAIQQSELVRQEASELGVTVSDKEVNEKLESYDPPLSKDYRDAVRAEMLVEKLRDEYFEQQVPQTAAQRHVWAMFLESRSQVNEVKDRLEAGEDFGELAAELSLDSTSKTKEGDLDWRPEGVLSLLVGSSILEENAFSCEVGILSKPIFEETKSKRVGYWLVEVLERVEREEQAEEQQTEEEEQTEEEQTDEQEWAEVKLRLILLGSEDEAKIVRARLETGEDFATLVEKYSRHDESKENGGEFEVTAEGMMGSAVDEFIFAPEIEPGTLSQPLRDDTVSTEGGYWLIRVTEADDNRQIEEEDRDILKADALNKWVEALWDDPDNEVESYLDEEKKDWAIMYVWGG